MLYPRIKKKLLEPHIPFFYDLLSDNKKLLAPLRVQVETKVALSE